MKGNTRFATLVYVFLLLVLRISQKNIELGLGSRRTRKLNIYHAFFLSWTCFISLHLGERDAQPIWTYWEGYESQLINKCLCISNRSIQHAWTIHLITENSLYRYLPKYTFPSSLLLKSPVLKSDYIRLRLLDKYGGWWLDPSVIVTSSTILTQLYQEGESKNASIVYFYSGKDEKHFLENNIMYSHVGNAFVRLWLNEMETMFRMGCRNYLYMLLRNGIALPKTMMGDYPKIDIYFAAFACNAVVFERMIPRRLAIHCYPAEAYSRKLMIDCHWNKECVKASLFNDSIIIKYPITKVFGVYRRYIDNKADDSNLALKDDYSNSVGIHTKNVCKVHNWVFTLYIFVLGLSVFLQSSIVINQITEITVCDKNNHKKRTQKKESEGYGLSG